MDVLCSAVSCPVALSCQFGTVRSGILPRALEEHAWGESAETVLLMEFHERDMGRIASFALELGSLIPCCGSTGIEAVW